MASAEHRHAAVAVDEAGGTELRGAYFRHQAPRWQFSQPGAGARTLGGRWNPPGSFATLYLADSPSVVVGELRRLADNQQRAIADFLPRDLLEYRVELSNVLDLTGEPARTSLGLPPAGDAELSLCQAIGEAAHHLGREGVLAPSATGSGLVLAVFPERRLPTSVIEEVRKTTWSSIGELP